MQTNSIIRPSILVLTALMLIVLIFIIVLCSYYRKRRKLLNEVTQNGNHTIFVIDKCDSNISADNSTLNHSNGLKMDPNNCTSKTKPRMCICWTESTVSSSEQLHEEKLLFPNGDDEVMDVENKEEELITQSSPDHSEGKRRNANIVSCHVDHELPSIPSIDDHNSKFHHLDHQSITTDDPDDLPSQSSAIQTHFDDIISSRSSSRNLSPMVTKLVYPGGLCPACSGADNPSGDDLSSIDYDPTYAVVRRVKVSCTLCGMQSLCTPANSHQNSNLSLQLNSCVVSPSRRGNIKVPYESLDSSTYASIVKVVKDNTDKVSDKEMSLEFRRPILTRQRSISQGDIDSNAKKFNENKENENIQINFEKATGANFMSLWSLLASNRNSPLNSSPIIPERTYGQSVVDFIEKLRITKSRDTIENKESSFERCQTQPTLNNSASSIINSKAKVRGEGQPVAQSCHIIDRDSLSNLRGLGSPLRLFGRDSAFCGVNSLEKGSSFSAHKLMKNSSRNSFLPVLTPPLSPLESRNSDPSVKLLTFDSIEQNFKEFCEPGSELVVSSNKMDDVLVKNSQEFDFLDAVDTADEPMFSIGAKDSSTSFIETVNPQTRPISIVVPRFDNLKGSDESNDQMSPLIEQSLENSSSKTTLSSLGYPQFTRLISSEDSGPKSPPSAGQSPSLEIIAQRDDSEFGWSNYNSGFDDYEPYV